MPYISGAASVSRVVDHITQMKPTRLTLSILLALSVLLSGCTFLLHPINRAFARHSNPIAGWHWSSLVNLQNNKAISEDYQDYIMRFPTKVRNRIGGIHFFEDGTGKHAVTIGEYSNGTEWTHVLIYDRNDKRIDVIKYVSGYYMS